MPGKIFDNSGPKSPGSHVIAVIGDCLTADGDSRSPQWPLLIVFEYCEQRSTMTQKCRPGIFLLLSFV
jgi:hypothetical protein